MDKKNCVCISKIDAAKRQLDVAIRLFLNNGDIVAIHTLTAAAYNILRDLSNLQSKPVLIKEKMLEMVKSQHKKMVRNGINEAENFFKHADEDSNKLLKFNPNGTEFLLWDACVIYHSLTSEKTPLMSAFNMWFFTKHTDVLQDGEMKAEITKLISEMQLTHEDKGRFLKLSSEISRITKL